jgi:hypothetical protein
MRATYVDKGEGVKSSEGGSRERERERADYKKRGSVKTERGTSEDRGGGLCYTLRREYVTPLLIRYSSFLVFWGLLCVSGGWCALEAGCRRGLAIPKGMCYLCGWVCVVELRNTGHLRGCRVKLKTGGGTGALGSL